MQPQNQDDNECNPRTSNLQKINLVEVLQSKHDFLQRKYSAQLNTSWKVKKGEYILYNRRRSLILCILALSDEYFLSHNTFAFNS